MELVKQNAEYSIYKKRSGRYCIQNPQGKWILGADKVKVLLAEKLIKMIPPKEKVAPAPAEAAPAPAEAAPAAAETAPAGTPPTETPQR